ncbi:multicopper oxidase, partial [Sphaerobolus stellatus SS14]
ELNLSAKIIAPDGFPRRAIVVNNQFPGPVIIAWKGDDIRITVNNHLKDPSIRQSTSVHWHGIFQEFNNENDGPSFITQCPIAPNNAYTYLVHTGDQAGTFW